MWKLKVGRVSTMMLGLTLSVASCSKEETPSLEKDQIEFLEEHGMELGQGLNSLNGDLKGSCIEFGPTEPTLDGLEEDAFDAKYSIGVVTSSEEVLKNFKVDASASASFIWKASAKASFAKEANFENNTVNLTAYGRQLKEVRKITTETLKPQFVELYRSNPQAFYQVCGDQYVSGLRIGVEYGALLSTVETNSVKRQDLEVSAKASGWGVGVTTDIKNVKSEVFKTRVFQFRSFQAGGAGADVAPPQTAEAVLERLRKLGDIAKTNPRILGATTNSYADLLPTELTANVDVIAKGRATSLSQIERMRVAESILQKDLADYIFAFKNYDQIKSESSKEEFKDAAKDTHTKLGTIIDELNGCTNDFDCSDLSPAKYERLEILIPTFEVNRKMEPGFCSGTGQPGPMGISMRPDHLENGADKEFKGRVQANVRGKLVALDDTVEMRIDASFVEPAGDATTAEGSESWTVYRAPNGYRVVGISGKTEWPAMIDYFDTDWEEDHFEASGDRPGTFIVTGDTKGDEAGTKTGFVAQLDCQYNVILEPK